MDKGIIGLKNRGNTCYLNTSIQCLSHLPLLTDYFINNNYTQDVNSRIHDTKGKNIKEIVLTKEYAKLIKAIWNSTTSIEPRSLHEFIQGVDDRFTGFDQQDSQESLALILDYLHEGLKYDVDISYKGDPENIVDQTVIESIKNWKSNLQNKYSIIAELFFGQFVNKIISDEPENSNKLISKKFEMFNMLNIPIHGKSLYDSLSKYFENERLETKYLDENTNEYINAHKQIRLMKIPKYLTIVLKRYKNDDNGYLLKSNSSITFPIENLDMSSYSDGYDQIECNLRLISIGCHRGVLDGGHYYAICRHRNNKWYKYDDDDVEEINIQKDKNTLFKDGYILIYEKDEEN